MPNFYRPDLGANADDPFARDGQTKLVRRGYWLDMGDRSIVLAMSVVEPATMSIAEAATPEMSRHARIERMGN